MSRLGLMKNRIKKYKEEEKEQKRQHKILKELHARFNLTGTETVINSGTVMAAQKGDKKNLALAENDKVFIIRMENNPAGKWLAKDIHGKVGYVDSGSIDIDTESIRNTMQMNVDSAYNLSIASSTTSATESSGGSAGEEYQNVETAELEQEDFYEDTG
ncbi:FYN-binding protein 1 [Lingula anatina]|uniref:FYN-binding protein 1 n=1 Tax=Lingula anatina TaxID=7574 RepID=A0A1S3H724_LINAN|nr:FYN-binding protein 1 [Lingula anatina]|eukprot:XP_013381281.1 FYN-binding protein 1 [Lingula anatina]